MQQKQEQWEGAAEASLPSTPAAAAWPHVADFFALHRYLPGIDVCERVPSGEENGGEGAVRVGSVRHCAAFAPGTETVATWAREELRELDPGARRLVYAVVASNMGFRRYLASVTVLPPAGAAEEQEAAAAEGCRIVWAFECEPVPGWSRDALLAYLDAGVKSMAARIEEEESANANTTSAPGEADSAVPPAKGGGAVAA